MNGRSINGRLLAAMIENYVQEINKEQHIKV